MKYTPTIGLEIHAELKTSSKMFSASPNTIEILDQAPNTAINAIDLAHPGTLPTINREALESMVKIGLAVGGDIANFTEFDRKHYFYPDIPKGYQISQYEHPIVSGGSVAGFTLTRIHLEEDTATSKHRTDKSLIDFNRAGVPLMELVTEPVLHSAEDVVRFARELQLLLRTLGVSDADIEKGQMRVEVNLSLSDSSTLGTKVEIKNIGSISAAGRATEYEIARQMKAIESGEEIIQETRGWDDAKGKTLSQRKKEGSADYRYFPDPDLPKLYLHEIFNIDQLRSDLPELPDARRERYRGLGVPADQIEILVNQIELGNLLDSTNLSTENIQRAVHLITSDIRGILNDDATAQIPNAEQFTDLVALYIKQEINSRGAKEILSKIMYDNTQNVSALAQTLGLLQNNDTSELSALVDKVIAGNPAQWNEFCGGKETLLQYFIGQVMKESRGSANPELVKEIIDDKIANNDK